MLSLNLTSLILAIFWMKHLVLDDSGAKWMRLTAILRMRSRNKLLMVECSMDPLINNLHTS